MEVKDDDTRRKGDNDEEFRKECEKDKEEEQCGKKRWRYE